MSRTPAAGMGDSASPSSHAGIYGLYWFYTAGGKVGDIQEYEPPSPGWQPGHLYLLLDLCQLTIVSMALMQNELNKVAGL